MERSNAIIQTDRLELISIPPAALAASLAGDAPTVRRLLDLTVPDDWFAQTDVIRLRLQDLRTKPALQPWLLRAIGLRAARAMVGQIGFHTGPDPDYLRDLAPGAIELGYEIYPAFRRQGYAREACLGLMAWARLTHGIERFIVSISPGNLPSLGLASQLGFERIGSHIDEVDGPEDIFLLDLARQSPILPVTERRMP